MVDIYTGNFYGPLGNFPALVHVGEFLVNISGGVSTVNKPTVEATVQKYVEIVDDHYDDVLVDVEGCVDRKVFRKFLEKQGTSLRFFPTGFQLAGKLKHLLK